MAFTDVLTKYLGFLLPEPKHDSFESLFYRNQHLLDCILNSINSENRLVAGTYNSGTGQLEGIRVKFVFGGAVSLVDFPITAVSIVATPQIWCANRISGTIIAINLAEYAQMVITSDDFPILYTGHHNDTHTTTAPFANLIATLNHNTHEQIRLNSPRVNEDVELTATATELNKLNGATPTTAEINILSGLTATTVELNKLDGVTVNASQINTLSGINGSIVDSGSNQTISGQKTFSAGINTNNAFIKTKVLSIGSWNMNAVGSINIAHGLPWANIRRATAIIRTDTGVAEDRWDSIEATFGSYPAGKIQIIDGNINLGAISGQVFNASSEYNGTGFTRGYVLIDYV